MQHIKNGTVIPLGVSSLARNASLPNVPTINETLPGFELLSWFGIFAPPQTPKPIIDRLYASIRKALNNPDLKARLNDEGLDTIESTPERFDKLFKSDIAFWQKFIKDNDIKID